MAAVGRNCIVLLALALLAACAEDGETTAQPAERRTGQAAAPRLDANQAMARLPETAAGLRRGNVLPVRGLPGAQEAPYNSPAGRVRAAALVRIAPAGAGVPDGPDSPAAQASLAQQRRELTEGRDHARRLREKARVSLPAGGPAAMNCIELEGTYGRQPVDGLACSGVIGGNMVWLKATMPRHNPPVADAQAFASEIAAALR